MSRLNQKVAVITGATSGIGLAMAKRFVEEGAFVYITGRRKPELDRAVKEIGKNVVGVQADSSKLADLKALYQTIASADRKLDIVVANAGGGEFMPLEAVTEAHFDQTFNTNVKGVLFTVQQAIPLLRDGASIILLSSNAAHIANPAFSVYSATKAAVRSFARNWTVDLKAKNVRVNSLSPGVTATPGLFGLVPEDQVEHLKAAFTNAIPLGRMADPVEIANTAVFLASNDSSFIAGADIVVDGGQIEI